MLSHLREKLQNLPPSASYSLAAALVLIAALMIYRQMRSEPIETAAGEPGIFLQCTNPQCNHLIEGNLSDFLAKGYLTAASMVDPDQRAGLCPKCKQRTLHFARRCPLCDKVFVPNEPDSPSAIVCPHCGKKPYAN